MLLGDQNRLENRVCGIQVVVDDVVVVFAGQGNLMFGPGKAMLNRLGGIGLAGVEAAL